MDIIIRIKDGTIKHFVFGNAKVRHGEKRLSMAE
jgi:hypothetical protein